MTTENPAGPKPKSARVEARKRRDEAMRKLGEIYYRAWLDDGRPVGGPEGSPRVAALRAVDDACSDVALQA